MKSRHTAAATTLLLVLVLATALMVPEDAYALGAPGAPTVFPLFTKEQYVAEGCPTVYTGALFPWNFFEGRVNLTVIDPPKGVETTFAPNPVMLRNSEPNFTMLIVRVTSDAPRGNNTLHIRVVPLPDSNYDLRAIGSDSTLNTKVTLNVGFCDQEPIDKYRPPLTMTVTTTATTTLFASATITTTTTLTKETTQTQTSTSIVTQSTTLTSTNTATEMVATDSSTYAWAVSATVATIVLAVVLLLKRRTA